MSKSLAPTLRLWKSKEKLDFGKSEGSKDSSFSVCLGELCQVGQHLPIDSPSIIALQNFGHRPDYGTENGCSYHLAQPNRLGTRDFHR